MRFSHGSFCDPFRLDLLLLTLFFIELFTICNYPNLGNRLADVSLNVFIQQIFLSASVVCQNGTVCSVTGMSKIDLVFSCGADSLVGNVQIKV